VGELARESRRHIHLVLENGDNQASLLDASEDPPRGKYRAQWNGDYQHDPHGRLARALSSGFIYQGEPAAFWGGGPRGEPSGHLSPTAFVNFLQNHDQIGNRVFGDRLESIA